MSNPNDSQIIEDAVNAFFSSIQATIDPKAELDLGGWAGINYDGHPDMKELEEIAGRVLAAHRVAVAESDAELAAAEPTAETLLAEIAALSGQSLDFFMSHAGRARICLRNNPSMRSQVTNSLAATLEAMRANLAARVTEASARRLVEALEAESDAAAAAAVTGTGSAAQDAANAAWNKAAAADAAALNKAAPRGAFLSWPIGSGVGGVQIADGQSLADAAAWNKAAAELEAAANAARSLDALVEAAHGLELAESCARDALAAAQDGRPEVDVVAKVKEARRMALAALINLNV